MNRRWIRCADAVPASTLQSGSDRSLSAAVWSPRTSQPLGPSEWIITLPRQETFAKRDLPSGVEPARFQFCVASGSLDRSPGMFRLYGYELGGCRPTPELLLRHQHPEDRPRAARIFNGRTPPSRPLVWEHRIVDAQGRQRVLVTFVEAEFEHDGSVTGLLEWCQRGCQLT